MGTKLIKAKVGGFLMPPLRQEEKEKKKRRWAGDTQKLVSGPMLMVKEQ